jgi:hypothetical protein
MFIDQNFAKNFEINYLDKPVKAYNMDGTENKWGTISSFVNLKFKLGDQKFNKWFYVTGLGKQKIILRSPWLHKYNLIIDWKKREITWKPFQIDWRRLYEKGQRIRKEWQPKIEEVADEEEKKNRTTSPLEENEMEVYIKLLDANVWIHKTNIATELTIENLNHSKITISPWQNKTTGQIPQRKDTSDHLSHLWHRPFSLFQKRMEKFDLVRTTGIWTIGWSKIPIHYHWSQKLWTNWKAQNTSLNWTYIGDTTIYGSEKVMNEKLLSKPIKDFSNQQ